MTAFLLGIFNTESGKLSIHVNPCRRPAADDIGRNKGTSMDEGDDGSRETVRRNIVNDPGKIEES